jgi:DMSO/TMAO reductase YedYZ molybdopterin-dependent catalytic subunit
VLAALIAAVVVSGVAHALGARSLGAVSTMQVHVGAAISSVPLAAWHLFARPVRPRAADLSRRSILRGAGVLGAGAALYVATEGVSRLAGLPGADRRFTGSHEVGSFDPTAMPATMWLNDRVPSRPDSVVEIDGRRWSVSELDVGDAMRVTLDCTGGWWSVHDWSGVLLDRVLASPHRAGRSVLVRSVTGYQRRLPLGDAPRLLLATRIDGEPVPAVHGGPVRLVAPGRRGFWWVKWIERVATQDTPWWWQPPFPLA